jgi:hypothetical protein
MTRVTNLIALVNKTVLFQIFSMKSLGRMSQTAHFDDKQSDLKFYKNCSY